MSQKEKIPNFFLLPFVVSVTIFYRSAHFISWGARRSFISVFRVMRIFSDPPNIDTPYPHPSSFSSFHLCHLIYMSNKRMNGIHSLNTIDIQKPRIWRLNFCFLAYTLKCILNWKRSIFEPNYSIFFGSDQYRMIFHTLHATQVWQGTTRPLVF